MTPRRLFRVALSCSIFLTFASSSWPAPYLPRVETLDNGLKVVLLEDHSSPLIAASVSVHAGGKNESEDVAGFAHYLEHLIPQGTQNRPPRREQLDFFQAGGVSTIRADYDDIYFFAEVPAAAHDVLLEGLFQQVSRASLTNQGIARIRPALHRELTSLYADPSEVLFLEQMRAAFHGQPYRLPYYGNFQTLKSLDHDSAEAFYGNLFVPNNMVLSVGGDITASKTLVRIKQLFGTLRPSKVLPPKPEFEPAFAGSRQVVKSLGVPDPSVSVLFVTPGYRHPDRYALAVLARLLDERLASLLGSSAGGTGKNAQSTSVRFHLLEERGLFAVSAVPLSAAAASPTGVSLLTALKSLRQDGFPDADVRRVARQIRLEEAVRRESIGSLIADLGESLLFGDVRYGWDLDSNLGLVTGSDVKRAANDYLLEPNCTTLILLPKSQAGLPKEDLDRLSQAASGLSAVDPSSPKPDFSAVLHPSARGASLLSHGDRKPAARATRSTLPNGLTLIVKSVRGSGLVAASLQIRAGSAFDPAGKEGLSQMMASVLSLGSGTMTEREFRDRAAAIGSGFGVSASRETVEAGLTVSAEDLPEALILLARPALEPKLSKESTVTARQRIEQYAGASALSPSEQARELLRQKLYRGHPYGNALNGTEGSLAAIQLEDLISFHRRTYRPERAVLSLAGDVDAAVARQAVGRAFGDWSVPEDVPKLPDLPAEATREALAGEFSRQIQVRPAAVLIGFPGAALTDPDFPLLQLLGTALSARCFLRLVLDDQLAVSLTAVPEGLGKGGILYLEATVASPEAPRVAYEMTLQARALAVTELSPEAVRDVLNIRRGQVLREKEGLYTLASNLGFYELLGAGFAAYEAAPLAPPGLTPASLKQAAARYLDTSRLARVTAGPILR